MNIRTIAVSLVCIGAVLCPLTAEPESGSRKGKPADESEKLTGYQQTLDTYFNSVGLWKGSAPEKRPENRIKPPDADEIIRTLDTMVKNVEMNRESMDKDAVIQVFRDYTKIIKKQRGMRTFIKDVKVCRAPGRRAVPLKTARSVPVKKKQAEQCAVSPEKKSPISTRGMMVYGPETPAGIYGIAVKKHIQEIKPMRQRTGFQSDSQNVEEMIETIRKRMGVSFVVDSKAISRGIRAGTVRSSITLKVDNMTFENALNWICRLAGLVWTMKDEAIFITTPERLDRADENQLKIYDIRDLKAPVPDFPAPGVAFGKDGDGFGDWGF